MKVSELRIGNYVKTCTPGMEIMIPHLETQVQGITLFGELMFCYSPIDSNGFNMPAHHVTGIPITEEWLLKFGFENVKGVLIKTFGIIDLQISDTMYTYFNVMYKPEETYLFEPRIKYVHQLQNLYYALTGEELIENNTAPSGK